MPSCFNMFRDAMPGPPETTQRRFINERATIEAANLLDVLQYKKGEQEAFGRIWQRLEPIINRFLKRKINNPEDREEVKQNSALYALQSLKQYRADGGSTVRNFILYAVNSKVLHYYKKKHQTAEGQSFHLSLDQTDEDTDQPVCVIADKGNPRIENIKLLIRAIDQCPPLTDQEREMLKLHSIEGELIKDIAPKFNLKKNRTQQIIESARKKLSTWLQQGINKN